MVRRPHFFIFSLIALVMMAVSWWPTMSVAETTVGAGGATAIVPPLNAGLNTQQKAGSLAVGDNSVVTKLCLNANPAQGVGDTKNCISAWSSIANAGGSFVAVSSNVVSIGTPPFSVPALSPSSYDLQVGAAEVKAITGQQASAIVRAPDVVFCDTAHKLCQSGSRYGQQCANDSQCPGAAAGSCRIGGICLDPREPHSCSRNSDCGYNATAVFSDGGSTGVAAQFNGTLYVQSVNGSAGQICLGHNLGPTCYSSWSQLASTPSYVKRFTPLPKPLTPQGAGTTVRYGAVISGSATFGAAVIGDSTGLPAAVTCGDGFCSSTESAASSCAVDCSTISAPVFSPTVQFASAPPALPKIDLNLQAATQSPSAVTILVVRSTGQSPTFVPVDGVNYSEGAVIGNSTIVKKVTTTSGAQVSPTPSDTLPSASGNYFYRTFQANSFPRYSPGSAVFPITIHTLSVTLNLPGKGLVEGSVNNIICDGLTQTACQAYYVTATSETLTVSATQSGYRVSGWSGCTSSDTFSCEVTMGADMSVSLLMAQTSGGGGGGGGSCFAAQTMVDTPLGPVAIERLHIGDDVYSYDAQTGRTVINQVTDTMIHTDQVYGLVTLSNGNQLEVTANHPFYDADMHTWREIGSMHVGDRVFAKTGETSRAVTITGMDFRGQSGTVYNITVARQHNYYVSGILVHNKITN